MSGSPRLWRRLAARLLAEFGVVVLGVSVALWADGWVADRQNRAIERARLLALNDNVTETLDDLREARAAADATANALTELAFGEGDLPDAELAQVLATALLYNPIFHPELNVYDDLKNSGELALLTDPLLRRALSRMDSRLELFRIAQDDLAAVQQLSFDPFVVSRLDLRLVLGPNLRPDVTEPEGDLDRSFLPSVEFRNLVLFKLDLARELIRNLDDVEDAVVAVRQALNESDA
jgi:hypothetical protein